MLGIRAQVGAHRKRRAQNAERTSRHVSDSPWRLGGRFDLLGPLGTGASGAVWRGREITDGSEHAIKLLRPELVLDAQAVTQLYATLNAVAQMAHPGVAAADDAVTADGWLALRSRLVLGESLRTLLSRQGALPSPHAAALIAQVCDTLAAAHAAGIAHGDLHPSNVLLPSTPDPTEAVVTDFGMAALINSAAARGVPATGTALSAPPAEYRAPEIGAGQSDTAPADVYAAGVLLYECLTGRAPFIAQWPDAVAQMHRESPPPPIAAVSDSLWRIVAACLEKDPRYRPTAAQLADALRAEAATAPPPGPATVLVPAVIPAADPVPDVAPTMIFDSYLTEDTSLSDAPRPRPHSTSGNSRLPRVITDHKTESGIAAAVVVVGLLIGAALSMGASGNTPTSGSPNAAAAGQAASAPASAATSAEPQAVVLPSGSPSPSASPSPSPSPSASASMTGNAVFVNVLSNKCMDTAGRAFANGTTEDIYDCNGTPAQAWTLTGTGNLTEDGGAYCLDDLGFGNTPGAKIGLWSCNGGTNQQWSLRPDGSIVSAYANLCLDVTGQGSDNFTPLVLEPCDGSPSQQWARH